MGVWQASAAQSITGAELAMYLVRAILPETEPCDSRRWTVGRRTALCGRVGQPGCQPGRLREARADRPVLLRWNQRGRHQSRWAERLDPQRRLVGTSGQRFRPDEGMREQVLRFFRKPDGGYELLAARRRSFRRVAKDLGVVVPGEHRGAERTGSSSLRPHWLRERSFPRARERL